MTDPLRIAVISPVWFPVPPDRYGGIEAIVQLLAVVALLGYSLWRARLSLLDKQ